MLCNHCKGLKEVQVYQGSFMIFKPMVCKLLNFEYLVIGNSIEIHWMAILTQL